MGYGLSHSEKKELVRSIVSPVIQGKKDRNIRNIYGRISPSPKDGRVRTSLAQIVETGRLASSESAFHKHSTNLQNLPKSVAAEDPLYRVRDCIVAPEGWLLMGADYEKAEAVCLAAYSGDWEYYELLHKGADVHRWHAAKALGVPESDVTDRQRQVFKSVTYASNYMAGVRTITRWINSKSHVTGLTVTESEVADHRNSYLNMHPIREWWRTVEKELEEKRYTVNAFGFLRWFLDPDPHTRLKEALANFPQSTVGSAIERAMRSLLPFMIDGPRCKILLQVHDELLFEVRQGHENELGRRVKRVMERRFPLKIHDRNCFIPVEVKAGRSWGQMKKLEL